MINPLTKIMEALRGLRAESPDIWSKSPGSSISESKVPYNKRVADRRRKNKSARKARQRNRS